MFRFTIRELVLLTVVVAMGAGWWIDRRDLMWAARIWRHRARDAAIVMTDTGWTVEWEEDRSNFKHPTEGDWSLALPLSNYTSPTLP